MVIDFRLGDDLLGQEVEFDAKPQFDVVAKGLRPLKMVQIIKDNRIVYSVQPDKREHRFQYTDMDGPSAGGAYYYVRCQQVDNQWAWSSAIWIDRPPNKEKRR
jgi:hypothetical protein